MSTAVALAETETGLQLVASEINILHGELLDAGRTGLEKAIRIGELLTERKAALVNGQWAPWLKANVRLTDRNAGTYMRSFKNKDLLNQSAVSDLVGAYRWLTSPNSKNEKVCPTAADGWLEPREFEFMSEIAEAEIADPVEKANELQERLVTTP